MGSLSSLIPHKLPIRAEVICINKPDRDNRHKAIDAFGFKLPDGTTKSCSQEHAIELEVSKKYSFFIQKEGKKVDIIPAISIYGFLELKTKADGVAKNNLLSLPECRWVRKIA